MTDPELSFDHAALDHALGLLERVQPGAMARLSLPASLPETGLGGKTVLDMLAPLVLGGAARLGDPVAMAHMDPPTPWITWATTLWNAALNQNLLHPATAPVAREIEARVVDWLAPHFGMGGGHMVPGSTVANLTALWAARECAGIDTVVFGEAAHLSVPKAAHLLGLTACPIPCDRYGAISPHALPGNLSRSALVLTAGTTSTGAVDDLSLAGRAAWTHVDAAWAGPLALSDTHKSVLTGIELADSVAISAHKWMFQPKESALVLFRDASRAHAAISFGGAYLATSNIGLLGSHGATAVPLLATLLAWGREGMAARIDRCMALADELQTHIAADQRLTLLSSPRTGVVVWRPQIIEKTEAVHAALPSGSTSVTMLRDGKWLRNVIANPNADINAFVGALDHVLNATHGSDFDPGVKRDHE